MPEKPVFSCPVCDSHCYKEVRERSKVIGPGSKIKDQLLFYSCEKCSVVFLDPVKFSNKNKS